MSGSSPHTRGARDCCRSSPIYWRIIPAYAGSTPRRLSPSWAVSDHPRIRGEHAGAGAGHVERMGSSPHTRGALVDGFLQVPEGRIIPAYAGSTSAEWRSRSSRRDHPRIRGEHPTDNNPATAPRGSSPHTRGARLRKDSGRGQTGIIPAYAGSTQVLPQSGSGPRDHPRIRGEH